ncbi:hypothetical protein ACT3WS_05615, partial [Brucella abortus]|uniref:hypothetical protein n=1 Tax=Brucella abortus TaxID=235 RepID=UPI00403FAB63
PLRPKPGRKQENQPEVAFAIKTRASSFQTLPARSRRLLALEARWPLLFIARGEFIRNGLARQNGGEHHFFTKPAFAGFSFR